MRRLRLAMMVVLVAGACTALNKASIYKLQLKPYQLVGSDFALPSGLRVFFQEDHNQASVIVAATVGSGASSDPLGREGLAHVVEHMCFRETHDGKPTVMDRIKMMGGFFNAFTAADNTTYYTVASKDALPDLLSIEAQRMLDPLAGVTEANIKTEIEVVRNELRLRTETNIANRMWEDLYALMYPKGHAYHRSGIGSHDTLDAITLADAQAFVKKHYRPDNITIVVAGDFDRQQAGTLLAHAFPPKLMAAPGHEGEPLTVVEPTAHRSPTIIEPPPPATQKFKHIQGPVTNTTILLGWSLPSGYHELDSVMQQAAVNMQPAVGSLLYPESIFEKDRIEYVSCFSDLGVVSSQAMCAIELASDDDPEVIARKAIDGLWEAWDLQLWKIRKRSLGLARSWIMADLFAKSSSLMRATDISVQAHFSGHPDLFSRSIAQLGQVNELQIRNFAFKYLNRDRVVVLIVEPYDAENRPTVAFNSSEGWAGAVHEESSGTVDKMFASLDDASIRKAAIAEDPATLKTFTLPNGLTVILKRHGDSPFAKLAMLFGGGDYNSTPIGLASYLQLRHDTKPPMQVAGRWIFQDFADSSMTGVEVPSGNLDAGLDLLASRIETTASAFESLLYKKTMERAQRYQKAQQRSASTWHEHEMYKRLLPGHPLAQTFFDFNALRTVDGPRQMRFIQRQQQPTNATLFVVGDIDLQETARKIQARFAAWGKTAPGKAMPHLPPPPPRPTRQMFLVDRPEAQQAEMAVWCPLPERTLANQAVASVAKGLLEEDLWKTIRERAGASYGVQTYDQVYAGGVAFLRIESTVQGDKLIPALRTVLDRVDAMARGDIDKVPFVKAKWNLARRTHIANLGLDLMLANLMSLRRHDLPIDALLSYPDRLAKVRRDDVSRLMQSCAGHEVIGIAGSAQSLEQPLQNMGIAFSKVDWPH